MECCICLDNLVNTAFLPCEHKEFCLKCAINLMDHGYNCSICRSKIDGIHLDSKVYSIKDVHLIIYWIPLMFDESGKINDNFNLTEYSKNLKKETWPFRRNVLNKALQYLKVNYKNIIKIEHLLFHAKNASDTMTNSY